jgi:hypothetical protein
MTHVVELTVKLFKLERLEPAFATLVDPVVKIVDSFQLFLSAPFAVLVSSVVVAPVRLGAPRVVSMDVLPVAVTPVRSGVRNYCDGRILRSPFGIRVLRSPLGGTVFRSPFGIRVLRSPLGGTVFRSSFGTGILRSPVCFV